MKEEKFSIVKRARSLNHASRGVWIFFKTTHNAWLHGISMLIVIALGFYFGITRIEWIMLIFAIGAVFTTEALNTAIEIDMDLTSPDHHPYAKDTKDVAAGAVLIASLTALGIGILIFTPYVFSGWQY